MLYSSGVDGARILNFESKSGSIKIIDKAYGDCNVTKEISFSTNGVSFSPYMDISEIGIVSVDYNEQTVFYRLKISIKIGGMGIGGYDLIDFSIDGYSQVIKSIELATELSDVITRRSTDQLYNPYRKLTQMNELYDQINFAISDVKGFDAIYFRTVSDVETQSVTFKSYRLNNVVESKKLKVVIKNNDLPEDLQQFNQYGFSFQDELIVHITTEEFKKAFGFDVIPNANDYFYLPLTDRVYQCQSPTKAKEFVQHYSFWEIATTKFEKRASVVNNLENDETENNEFHSIDDILKWTHDYESDRESTEQYDATKPYEVDELDGKTTTTLNHPYNEVSKIGKQNSNDRFYHLFNFIDKDLNVVKFSGALKTLPNSYQASLIFIPHTMDKIFELIATTSDYIILKQKGKKLVVETSSTVFTKQPIKDENVILTNVDENKTYGVVLEVVSEQTLEIRAIIYEFVERSAKVLKEVTFLSTILADSPKFINFFGGGEIGQMRLTNKLIEPNELMDITNPLSKNFLYIKNATANLVDVDYTDYDFYNSKN